MPEEQPVAEATDEPVAAEAAPRADHGGGGRARAPVGPEAEEEAAPALGAPHADPPKRVKATERKPIVRLEKPEHERGRRQERQGKVVSDAMEKTIVVKVEVVKAHPRYKKVVRRSVKFHAHDETGQRRSATSSASSRRGRSRRRSAGASPRSLEAAKCP